MSRRIHITAVASPAHNELKRIALPDLKQACASRDSVGSGVDALVELARQAVGPEYAVTVNEDMLGADELDRSVGRTDDEARAREIETLLADDEVAALVTIRGGAWLVRILDRINFDVLEKRTRPIHIFGFSEITPLINIAGQYPQAVGVYYLGPGFVFAGVKSWAVRNFARLFEGRFGVEPDQADAFAAGFAAAHFRGLFADFFRMVRKAIEGGAIDLRPTGTLLAGELPAESTITVTGGTLSVMTPLLGTRWSGAVDPAGKWLSLEDVNECPEQCDRMLAGLKHNGFFERAEGIILGDFHDAQGSFSPAVAEILQHHLPPDKRTPIVHLENLGHTWPMAPLPMHRPLRLRRLTESQDRVAIDIPWGDWAK